MALVDVTDKHGNFLVRKLHSRTAFIDEEGRVRDDAGIEIKEPGQEADTLAIQMDALQRQIDALHEQKQAKVALAQKAEQDAQKEADKVEIEASYQAKAKVLREAKAMPQKDGREDATKEAVNVAYAEFVARQNEQKP